MQALMYFGLNSSSCSTPILLESYDVMNNANSMPPIISYEKPETALSHAKALFPAMRSLSKEEEKKYIMNIDKLYKHTGMKLF